mmetsp:Transcript_5168/g.15169  ORF Transcript_5168/g.15169 Transcript_5168/m.15169 type:complete len:272 (+) Transcript_5168:870-1685(+)
MVDPIRRVKLQLRGGLGVLRPEVPTAAVCGRAEPEEARQLLKLDKEIGPFAQLPKNQLQALLPEAAGVHAQLPHKLHGERQAEARGLVLEPPPQLPAEVGQQVVPAHPELQHLLERRLHGQALAPGLGHELLHGAFHLQLRVEGQQPPLGLSVEQEGILAVREDQRLLLLPLSVMLLEVPALRDRAVMEAPFGHNPIHLAVDVPQSPKHQDRSRSIAPVLARLCKREGHILLHHFHHSPEVFAREPLQPAEEQALRVPGQGEHRRCEPLEG